jgi:alpha-tubulin suppressor-like RCC1 family protein
LSNVQYGQLGIGSIVDSSYPSLVTGFSNIIMIATGWYHTMMLNSKGIVYSFGRNDYGQIGDDTFTSPVINPVPITFENDNVIKIDAGEYSSSILKKNGKVYFFGYGSQGQLGVETGSTIKSPITPLIINTGIRDMCLGDRYTMIRTQSGIVYSFGENGVLL